MADSDSRSPSAAKPAAVVAAWQEAGLKIALRAVNPVSEDDLSRAHDARFVRAVLAREIPNGFGNTREDVAHSLPYTSGAMLDAARSALSGRIACAPVAGFHHAGYESASMFCTFNGLMVAAMRLLQDRAVRKILILDCDYHFGNGTEDIIARLGVAPQVENVTFGRWYRNKSDAKLYLGELQRTALRFEEYDLILYQAGADVHVDDPLGGLLTSDQMRTRDRIVFEAAAACGTSLAWNLAGGYQTPISKVLRLHTATMQECERVYG